MFIFTSLITLMSIDTFAVDGILFSAHRTF